MLKQLELTNFKSFKTASLKLGPFTVIVGANASGKTNLRDAFRFLHGIARGYTLTETLEQKPDEGGEVIWRGIRGGIGEVFFSGSDVFEVSAVTAMETSGERLEYRIKSSLRETPFLSGYLVPVQGQKAAVVDREVLLLGGKEFCLVDRASNLEQFTGGKSNVWGIAHPDATLLGRRDIIVYPLDQQSEQELKQQTQAQSECVHTLLSMAFLDLHPDSMRQPSRPGQQRLGARGQYLASVLQAICAESTRKESLLEWIRALTPMDVADIEFVPDPTGQVWLFLVDHDEHKVSAESASDGTLRFLGFLAALLGPEPAGFYFLEEIENGIHPTRLHLLINLIEKVTAEGKIQVVATTHSPALLGQLSQASLENASVTYRLEGQRDTKVKRILDVSEEARDVIKNHGLSDLHASGWIEDMLFFSDDDEAQEEGSGE